MYNQAGRLVDNRKTPSLVEYSEGHCLRKEVRQLLRSDRKHNLVTLLDAGRKPGRSAVQPRRHDALFQLVSTRYSDKLCCHAVQPAHRVRGNPEAVVLQLLRACCFVHQLPACTHKKPVQPGNTDCCTQGGQEDYARIIGIDGGQGGIRPG